MYHTETFKSSTFEVYKVLLSRYKKGFCPCKIGAVFPERPECDYQLTEFLLSSASFSGKYIPHETFMSSSTKPFVLNCETR